MLQKHEKLTRKPKSAKSMPYSPQKLQAFLAGRLTLADLEGVTKTTQYELAEIGYKFLQEGRIDRAEKVFAGLLALDPFDAYFHLVMGSIAQRRKDLPSADKFYSRALEINPWSIHALSNRGEVRLQQGRILEAIDDLVKAIDEDRQGLDAASQRARLLLDAVMKKAQAAPKQVPAAKAR